MPTAASTALILHEVTEIPVATVNGVIRKLIDDGILPKSSGRRIEKLTVRNLGEILFALYASDKLSEASKMASTYSNLVCENSFLPVIGLCQPTAVEEFERVFGEFLSEYYEQDHYRETSIEICINRPIVRFHSRETEGYSTTEYIETDGQTSDMLSVPLIFAHIRARALDMIANDWMSWDLVQESGDPTTKVEC